MDKVTIEITKEEAALLPLLYKVPLNTNLEAAAQVMKNRILLDGLIEKVKAAFASPVETIETGKEGKPRRRK